MADPRTNYQNFYKRAGLSSFSDKELNFVSNPPGGVGSNFGTSPIDKIQKENTSFTTVNRDSNGNITGYTFTNLPGLTSNGKPTQQTTDYLINNGKPVSTRSPGGSLTDQWEVKLPNGNVVKFSPSEMGSIIRERHGMSETDAAAETYGMAGFSSGDMKDYISANSDARKLINKTNEISKRKQQLIDSDILVRTEEEILDSNGRVVATAEAWVYGDNTISELEGQKFDEIGPITELMNEMGIGPYKTNIVGRKIQAEVDPVRANRIAAEYDQLASGYLTRDPKDGSRIDSNGNVSGGSTLDLAKVFVPTGTKEDGSPLYTAKTVTGYSKKGTQGVVVSGIIGGFIGKMLTSKFPAEWQGSFGDLLAHKIHHAEEAIAGGTLGGDTLPLRNKLIWIKTLYGSIALAQGKQTLYNNPVTPWVGHALIHYGSKLAVDKIFALTAAGITSGGVAAFLELLWIVGEWGYEWYDNNISKPDETEEKQKEREKQLEQEAIKKGCLVARYVQSNGKACIRCKPRRVWDPIRNKWIFTNPSELDEDTQLPIGIERDKNGDIIYEPDPTKGGLPKPKYIYPSPQPQSPPQLPPRGGTPGVDRPVPIGLVGTRNFYGPPNNSGRNPMGETSISQTVTDPVTGQGQIVAFAIVSHNATKESNYLGHINAQYVGAKNAEYMQNLMSVRTISNGDTSIASTNAGPIYSAASPAPQLSSISTVIGQDPADELESIRQRDRLLEAKDKAWLSLLWAGGSTDGGGNGVNGGGSVPPSGTPQDSGPETMGSPESIIVRGTFMLDMGFDVLYVVNGVGTIISKSNRPTIQYGSDSMG